MSAFTPGPWTIRFDFNVFGNDRLVGSAGGYSSNTNSEQVEAENIANAHLIAAAPDLYAALKHYVSHHTRESYDMALAALAKADGGK